MKHNQNHIGNSQLTNIISARLKNSQGDNQLAQKISKFQTTLNQQDLIQEETQNKKLRDFNQIANQKDQCVSLRGKNMDFGKIFLKQKDQIVALKIKELESRAQLEKASHELDRRKPKIYQKKSKIKKPWSYQSFDNCGYRTFYRQQILSAPKKTQQNKKQQKQFAKINILSRHNFNKKKEKQQEEDFSFLTREDLQNTLDKSRSSIKNLLIKHIKNRKQMLKKNRYSNFQKKQFSSSLLIDTRELKKKIGNSQLNKNSFIMRGKASQIQSIIEDPRQNSPKDIKQAFPQPKIKVDRQFVYLMQRKINQKFKNSLEKEDVFKKLKKTILEPIYDRKQLQRSKEKMKIQKNLEELQKFKLRRMSKSVSNLDSNSNNYSLRSSVKMSENHYRQKKQFQKQRKPNYGSYSNSNICFSQEKQKI